MRLRPEEPIADASSPFGHDHLNFQAPVELLACNLSGEAGPAVLCINGRWGSGKSTFLNMLAAHLQDLGHCVIALCALDICRDQKPTTNLISLASVQLKTMMQSKSLGGTPGLTTSTPPTTEQETQDADSLQRSFDDESPESIQSSIQSVVLNTGGPLFVLVDNLDKCGPQAALAILDVLRRAFGIPGTIVVLAASQDELAARIRHHLGAGTDAVAMLGGLIDESIDIPAIGDGYLMPFVEHVLSQDDRAESHTLPYAEVLASAHRHWNLTPRDVARIALRVSAALDSAAPPDWFVSPSPGREDYGVPMTAIAALHYSNPKAFNAMFRQPIVPHVAALELLSAAMPTRSLEGLVALLLIVALRHVNTTIEAFSIDCLAAGFSKPDQIERLHTDLVNCRKEIRLDRSHLDNVLEAWVCQDFCVSGVI